MLFQRCKVLLVQLCLFFFIVTLCITVTINFHPLYWYFVKHYDLAQSVGVTTLQLKTDYLKLLAYLNYPWVTDLKMSIPVSYNGMRHFEDVKRLFLVNYLVLRVTAFPAISYFLKLWRRREFWKLQNKIYGIAVVLFCLGCFMLLDFQRFFVYFHRILFNNNNWIFDPNLDPVINALPSTYFLACFGLFLSLFAGSLGAIFWLGKRQAKNN